MPRPPSSEPLAGRRHPRYEGRVDRTDPRWGTVTDEPDGGRRLEFRRTWPDDVDDVWAALTAPDRTQRWIGRYDGERRGGATGSLTRAFEDGTPSERLTIAECAAPHRLVLEWPDVAGRRAEVDLAAQRGGTTLILVLRAAGAEGLPDVATGWHWYLDRLDAEISGTEPPGDWDTFLADVGPRYGRAG